MREIKIMDSSEVVHYYAEFFINHGLQSIWNISVPEGWTLTTDPKSGKVTLQTGSIPEYAVTVHLGRILSCYYRRLGYATLHMDFTLGAELSWLETMERRREKETSNFSTHVLTMFGVMDKIVAICKNGDVLIKEELYTTPNPYTVKQIRPEHAVDRMLIAGSFQFKKVI